MTNDVELFEVIGLFSEVCENRLLRPQHELCKSHFYTQEQYSSPSVFSHPLVHQSPLFTLSHFDTDKGTNQDRDTNQPCDVAANSTARWWRTCFDK